MSRKPNEPLYDPIDTSGQSPGEALARTLVKATYEAQAKHTALVPKNTEDLRSDGKSLTRWTSRRGGPNGGPATLRQWGYTNFEVVRRDVFATTYMAQAEDGTWRYAHADSTSVYLNEGVPYTGSTAQAAWIHHEIVTTEFGIRLDEENIRKAKERLAQLGTEFAKLEQEAGASGQAEGGQT